MKKMTSGVIDIESQRRHRWEIDALHHHLARQAELFQPSRDCIETLHFRLRRHLGFSAYEPHTHAEWEAAIRDLHQFEMASLVCRQGEQQ